MAKALLMLVAWLVGADAFGAEAPVHVVAVANSESFDPDLPVLKYPADDLARFVKVMARTGEVPERRIHQLVDGTSAKLKEVVKGVARDLKREGSPARIKFVFYFTGHSDATGLHLADGLFRKEDLHALLAEVPAETRIALLDSCYSGALAAKGIKPAAGFVVPQAEFDEPSGSVFLAATSGSDVAFEVEELKGSLFTHHLVNGLYGGADANQDGLVTIDEIYQYVYRRMSSEGKTLPGREPQKPEYRVDLQGRGALILSFLEKTTSAVTLAPDVAGELTFVADNGLQIFRLTKAKDAAIQTKLVPADYTVTLKNGDLHGKASLKVEAKRASTLAMKDFALERKADLAAVAKGQRPMPRWGFAVGVNGGSYAKWGPHAEVQLSTRSVRVESSYWRLVSYVGGHQNELDYIGQTGQAKAASLLLGVHGSTLSSFGFEGQQWHVLVGGGADYMWADWNRSEGEEIRTFDPLLPKIALGFGTTLIGPTGRALGLSFRREWPFAEDSETGDVLAFGANVITLSAEW